MPDFVTLTCPTCGGKLQITNDIDRFACGHCGNEQIVKRSGGIVSIAPVMEGLQKIESATSATVDELSIRRLRDEINESRNEVERLARLITTLDYKATSASLSNIGKLSFWKYMKEEMKSSDQEKDVDICIQLIKDLSVKEMERFVKKFRGKYIVKTRAKKDRIAATEQILRHKKRIAQNQLRITQLKKSR